MISFRSFSLVISIVLLRQVALQSQADVISGDEHPFTWLIGGCVLFCVIGKFLPVFAMIRADAVGRAQGWREMEQHRLWLEWAWLVTHSWLWANSGAAQVLAGAEHQGWSPAIMLLAWCLPTLVFLSALEFGFTQLECLWSADGDQSSRAHRVRWLTRVRLGALGNVVTCLVPVLVLLLAMETIGNILPGMSELGQATLALVCLGVVGLTFAPLWLRLWMGAHPVSNDQLLAERIHFFCQRMRIPMPKVCTVGLQHSWHGVALVGWTPLFRQLWIGTGIERSLTAEQLDMVLLHELAHLKRGHCWWRIIPLLIVGITCVYLLASWPGGTSWGWEPLMTSGLFAISMIWMLGVISRQCEMDADRQACNYAAQHCTWADGQAARAMILLGEALAILHDPQHHPAQRHWLHPSLSQRVAAKTSTRT